METIDNKYEKKENNLTLNSFQKTAIEALKNYFEHKPRGLLLGSMRSGKTASIIYFIEEMCYKKVLWLCENTNERDFELENEFKKWKKEDIFINNITPIYPSVQSLQKININAYDIIIYNECQKITEGVMPYLKGAKKILGMTGTYPNKNSKRQLLNIAGISKNNLIYEYNINDASEDNLISDFEINVIKIPLSSEKNIERKAKKTNNTFYTSEQDYFNYLQSQIEELDLKYEKKQKQYDNNKILISKYDLYEKESIENKKELRKLYDENRTLIEILSPYWRSKKIINIQFYNFLNTSKSILNYTKLLLNKFDKLNQRTIVFAFDSNHANLISNYTYNSKTGKKNLNLFQNHKIPHLVLINKGGTGTTYTKVDNIILLNINSSNSSVLQKLGRGFLNDSDKKLNVYVLYAGDIQLKWFKKATEDLDQNKFKYI